jgi:hypothetical protein
VTVGNSTRHPGISRLIDAISLRFVISRSGQRGNVRQLERLQACASPERANHMAQQDNWSREILSLSRFPKAVTAIELVWKKSLAIACKSSAVTTSIFSITSSIP